MDSTFVPVKSAWFSKINWTQFVAFGAMMLASFGFDLDAETQSQIVLGIAGIQTTVTWALRTFFTTSVTPAAAGK